MDVLAYLDAGSGSMILQAVLGGVAGFVVAIKMFGRRVFSTLAFWRRDEDTTSSASEPAPVPDRDPA